MFEKGIPHYIWIEYLMKFLSHVASSLHAMLYTRISVISVILSIRIRDVDFFFFLFFSLLGGSIFPVGVGMI